MAHCLPAGVPKKLKRDPNCPLKRLFDALHTKRDDVIKLLREFVAFQTVSTRTEQHEEQRQATEWLVNRLVELSVVAFAENMSVEVISHTCRSLKMPKTVLGELTRSSDKPTILVYGHMDVEDAALSDGWQTQPFTLTAANEFLYGRGTALGKGPLLCWLNAIQCYRDANVPLPLNVVFLIESMSQSDSLGLEDVIRKRQSCFREVSCVCIAAGRWLTKNTPCLIYGSRGVITYKLEVQSANRDLSSCEHGGTLYEALPDLFYLLSALVSTDNNIRIPGLDTHYEIDASVLEQTVYNPCDTGAEELPSMCKSSVPLGCNWALPHISIHGIEGAQATSELCFVIPHKVVGKFSIAIAPHQSPAEVTQQLSAHLREVWTARGSPNKMSLCELSSVPAWTAKCNTPEYKAAVRAAYEVYGKLPSITRYGGAMQAPSILKRCLDRNVIVFPIANADDGRSSVNERIAVEDYINGGRMLAAFMYEYAKRHKESLEDVNGLAKASHVRNF